MCGRFSVDTDIEKLKQQFAVTSVEPLPKSRNVAPTEAALCLIATEEGLKAVQMRWGIVPWYAKGKKSMLLINARAEQAAEKPAFKQAIKYRRCLLIMNGFFEWQHHPKDNKTVKQPYYIHQKDNALLAVAAIWERFEPEPDLIIPSCCLLTTSPNELVGKLHDRMPWFLDETQQAEWLSPTPFSAEEVSHLLQQPLSVELACHPVTPKMNSALYKGDDCIEALSVNDSLSQ
ncbi:Putative SOS response-associated peptidase YedK [Legionella quinlivanii DSM 21216]|uniref:SOS response-associated peptidase n=3 Tax=Legionella TaxID=445 RepID=UPI00089F22AE|nr:SOS response-associated peptidase [Legionella quinlivanii]SEG41353.1 Putative SOS response-associated peptidase YedK [Legionella quinlivanii DSM 21216]